MFDASYRDEGILLPMKKNGVPTETCFIAIAETLTYFEE